MRYGTKSEGELLDLAELNEVTYIALTDINSTSAIMNFLREARTRAVWPVVGVDFRNGTTQRYIILARNNKGMENINRFLSKYLHAKKAFPDTPPALDGTYVIYPFERVLEMEKVQFSPNERIGISTANLRKLPFSKYKGHTDILVVHQTVTFSSKSDFNAHRLLRCIDLNTLLSKLDVSDQGDPNAQMLHMEDLLTAYGEYPFIRENTKQLMQRCQVNYFFDDDRTNQNQDRFLESREADYQYLKVLVYDKLNGRYPDPSQGVHDRIERELGAIRTMDFVSYFLINHDIIGYARSKGYFHIGRGSGANSIVAYIIGITNVDPIDLDLYFERFINVHRNSPPDFDIDFSWKDRDDITRYIFERFPNVALMGTYVTFRYRAVIREISKVFGIPKDDIDKFLSGQFHEPEKDRFLKLVIKYSGLIRGFPNYVSVHSCGIIITKKPVHYYSATFMPPKGFPTVMFDMNIAEDVGIFKFDILAQRGLSKISDCLDIIAYNQPSATVADIDDVDRFKKDENINELLKTGDCIGVFYVESPAMRVLMTKLRTQDYLGLVAASSIIRPGVSSGGMKNQYILRHRFPEKRKEAHPVMLEIMEDTYGVMVYQEDVLKVAHKFAGLSLAEADIMRRGMRGKSRSKGEFEKVERKFKSNCLEKGYTNQVTGEIWEQIQAFAGYAFAKGHSASYAVESYQSLYLKRYFPLEFMVAVLNNGGGFYNIETYVLEIIKHGGQVEMPCLNESDHPNIIRGRTVYLGFGMIRDLEDRTVQKLLSGRQLGGKYLDLEDIFDRLDLALEQLVILIRANALRFTGINKLELMWKAHLKSSKNGDQDKSPKLFQTKQVDYEIPKMTVSKMVEALDQMLLLGFPLISRFELLKETVSNKIGASDLPLYKNRTITIYGSLVAAKGTPTADKRLMYFGTFLDHGGNFFDTVHFPNIAKRFPLRASGIYGVTGTVTEELGYHSINVQSMVHMAIRTDPRGETGDDSVKYMGKDEPIIQKRFN